MDVDGLIKNALAGDTVQADAKGFDKFPEQLMRALRGNPGVTLVIRWNEGEIIIPSGKAVEPEGLRVYYPLSYLQDLYAYSTAQDVLQLDSRAASPASSKINPETGGVWRMNAPASAAFAQATSIEDGIAPSPAQKQAFTAAAALESSRARAAEAAQRPTGAAKACAAAAVAAICGIWLYKKRDTFPFNNHR